MSLPTFKAGDRVRFYAPDAHYDAEQDADGNYEEWTATVVRWNDNTAADDDQDTFSEYWVRPDVNACPNGEPNEEGLYSVLAAGLSPLE